MQQLAILFSLFCFGQISTFRFFHQDEINHIRASRDVTEKVNCDDDKLMNFLAEIQVINPESIMKLATLKELEPSCRKVAENIAKIKEYLQTCTPAEQQNLYVQLIKGVESLYDKLCTESNFKQGFQSFHKCLHELNDDFENCDGPADWNENSEDSQICKAYKDIADCYYIKAAKVCGKDAAKSIKDLLNSVIDSIITVDCANVKENPTVKDEMPAAYIRKTNDCSKICPSGVLLAFTLIIIFI